MPRNKRLTVKEQILDWFDCNPGSKARSGPLAKALKIGSTTCADALAKLAAEGKLSRVKTKIDEGTGQGSRPEQWEYSIPAPETVAQPRTPTPFKPLGAQPRVYRRHSPVIENAPSVMTGPVHAPAQTIQEPQPDEIPGRDVAALPAEHLADHIKARLERAESDLESMAVLETPKAPETRLGAEVSPTLEAITPVSYAVVAPKKPIQRFSARHNAAQAATAAARTVGSAEIYGMYRIARASRGAVVIREA